MQIPAWYKNPGNVALVLPGTVPANVPRPNALADACMSIQPGEQSPQHSQQQVMQMQELWRQQQMQQQQLQELWRHHLQSLPVESQTDAREIRMST